MTNRISSPQNKIPSKKAERIDLGPAPCPHCGYSLVPRVDWRGPFFYCLCAEDARLPRKPSLILSPPTAELVS